MRAHQDGNGPLPDFLDSVPHGWSEATHQGRIFIFDAFISHATVDVERSRTLSDTLGARGLRIWHDDEQRMDDARWALRLGSALRNSRFVIVVAAPDSDLMLDAGYRSSASPQSTARHRCLAFRGSSLD
jgi:TIR domain